MKWNVTLVVLSLFIIGCDSSEEDLSMIKNKTMMQEKTQGNTNANTSTEADVVNYSIPEEPVSSDPVFINDKKLDPPPSPHTKLRKNFKGRQKKYAVMINRISKQFRVDSFLTHAIISQESWYRPAVGSPAGAVGLMQLIPGAAKRFGCVNRRNPQCNVRAGVKYLKYLARRFEGRGNIQTIAAGYNAGEAVAESYLKGTKMRGKNPLGRKTANGVPGASFGYNAIQKRICSGNNVLPGHKCEGETYHYARQIVGYYMRYKRKPHIVRIGDIQINSSSRDYARNSK